MILTDFLPQFYQGRVRKYATRRGSEGQCRHSLQTVQVEVVKRNSYVLTPSNDYPGREEHVVVGQFVRVPGQITEIEFFGHSSEVWKVGFKKKEDGEKREIEIEIEKRGERERVGISTIESWN
ncbi:hypothetical protein AVEN_238633-1 [Araneus ventricosus]|uniref:Uncharacterized protein n=1 Tax=Araneus ventricosus TaxID=182803 RepID=A0A4Y2V5S5_ARAVE|nr:hypothetical protein AVEN_238633-1 [Araneus ventricosus]